ncbi:transcription regulator [Gracilibacillus boraciitolerans JCM 21714]|uniref:Transcription regulator n=1 Tax=Gracilibacillus boraciitolerans JCM 21714 TaxID=1298598 RepID=W4VQH8_9BACI|nr:diacylglycerol kinase family protein [Gracilibacillus boraciitolerans]GAE95466.1 transcription regulator [Gracilibacillus boraciitolerans JCM 21714]
MEKHAMIIINPSSGTEKSIQFKQDVYDILIEKDYSVTINETKKENDAKNFAIQASKDAFDLITIMGGDGTVNEVINGIAEQEHRPKLHIIPLGTVNNFAKAVEIPLKTQQAIDVIKDPTEKLVDIGKINNHYFMNLVNIGAIAEATYQVTAEQKSKLGSLAYFIEGLKKFNEKDIFSVKIKLNETTQELDAMLVLIALTDTFGGFKNAVSEADINDGYLHVFVFQEMSTLEILSIITSLVNGQLKDQHTFNIGKRRA